MTSLAGTLPAGLLPAMSADLGVGESAAGRTVTVYPVGPALTAIPLTAATAGWRRKRMLLTAMAGGTTGAAAGVASRRRGDSAG